MFKVVSYFLEECIVDLIDLSDVLSHESNLFLPLPTFLESFEPLSDSHLAIRFEPLFLFIPNLQLGSTELLAAVSRTLEQFDTFEVQSIVLLDIADVLLDEELISLLSPQSILLLCC